MENCAYEDEANRSARERLIPPMHQIQHHFQEALQLDSTISPTSQAMLCSNNLQQEHQKNPSYDDVDNEQHQQLDPTGHVYEDVLFCLERGRANVAGIGCFHRNLTLPLSRGCDGINGGPSSSMRLTSREQQRRLNSRGSSMPDGQFACAQTENNSLGNWESGRDESLCSGSGSPNRPNRRRRKRDCKHCRSKTASTATTVSPSPTTELQETQEQQFSSQSRAQIAQMQQGSQLGLELYRLGDQCLQLGNEPTAPPLVDAIGCNAADCTANLADGVGCGDPASATLHPSGAQQQNLQQQQLYQQKVNDESIMGSMHRGGLRAAGMKVNSIYAQDHWLDTGCGLHLADHKIQDCGSSFQQVYGAVSMTSPTLNNQANLRHSVRDFDPAETYRKAKLHMHRHGWGLPFGDPFSGISCTKSFVLLLIVVLALLGIGGIALYMVFEPERLHVIQQYLRSSAQNSSAQNSSNSVERDSNSSTDMSPVNFGSSADLGELILSSTVQYSLTSLLGRPDDPGDRPGSSSSINSNHVPAIDVHEQPKFDNTRPSSKPVTDTRNTSTTSIRKSSGTAISNTSTTTRRPTTSSSSASLSSSVGATMKFEDSNSGPRRPCFECSKDEVCVARSTSETPHCQIPQDRADKSGCGGLCNLGPPSCHKINEFSYRCENIEQICLDNEWMCLNVMCVPLVKRCDGQMDCYDHSDEFNCECDLQTHFRCGNKTSCLSLSKKCDGFVDCYDASDEKNCTTKCSSKNERTCANKQQCYLRRRFCDGYKDCSDGSDEPHVCQLGKCNKHEFTCRNGRCIDETLKCNSHDECGDGSDELHCRMTSRGAAHTL